MTTKEFRAKVNDLLNVAGTAERDGKPEIAGELYREAYNLTRDPIIRRYAIAAEAAAAVAS